ELTTEQRLVRERRIDEIPGVLMLLVEIADAGEEPAELGYHAIGQRRHQAIRLLDRHGVLRRKRHREIAREIRIDGGSERKLRFAEAQPAPAGAHLIGFLESRDRVLPRVLLQVRVRALQHERYRRIECGESAASGGPGCARGRRRGSWRTRWRGGRACGCGLCGLELFLEGA